MSTPISKTSPRPSLPALNRPLVAAPQAPTATRSVPGSTFVEQGQDLGKLGVASSHLASTSLTRRAALEAAGIDLRQYAQKRLALRQPVQPTSDRPDTMEVKPGGVVHPRQAPAADLSPAVDAPVPQAKPSDVARTEATATWRDVMKPGSRGEDVRQLQETLKAAGYDVGPIDGKFGPLTEAAVKAYQADHGLTVDGKVGEKTRGSLEQGSAPVAAGHAAQEPAAQAPGQAAPTPSPEGDPAAPSSTSGPAPTGPSAAEAGAEASKSAVDLEVPFVSQWTLRNPREACFRACQAMLAGVGLADRGPDQALWLNGTDSCPASSAAALQTQLDADLDAGKPVSVGVDRPGGKNTNADGVTDHWVVVTGRGIDEQGRAYYTFNDPGRRAEANGSDQNPQNRLYVDEATGRLYSEDDKGQRRYEVTAVRTSEAA